MRNNWIIKPDDLQIKRITQQTFCFDYYHANGDKYPATKSDQIRLNPTFVNFKVEIWGGKTEKPAFLKR
jgi:hypothetical protein